MSNPLETIGRALAWHKERHRPSGFSFSIADSIDFIDQKQWSQVTGRKSFFLEIPYLRALENNAPANMRLRYALIFDGKRPAAAAVMQVVDVAADRVAKTGAAETLSRVHARAVVCGNLLSWGRHGAAFAEGFDPSLVWPGVAEALYRVRQAEKLSAKTDLVMVKDIDNQTSGVEALERFSYNALDTDPDMVLSLNPTWRGFEDYLSSLQSKYRKNALRVEKDLREAGCTVEPLGDWKRDSARIFELYLQVHAAAAVRPVTAAPNYLPAIAQAAGDDMRCTVIRRGADLLGFVTTIKENADTAIGYQIGFDRAARQELPLYFGLLQAVIADAIALGCKRVSFGRTALEPKAKLGARPNPIKIWVRHSNALANILVRRLLTLVAHDEAPERNPFKEV